MKATRTMPDSGEFGDAHPLVANALFGRKQQQKRAFQQIRANSGLTPGQWQQLDEAFVRGYYSSNALTSNAQTLDYDEWEDRDDMVVEETQEVLTAVDDLVNAGFVRDTSLARLVSTYEVTNDFDADIVERSMDGRARGTEDSTIKEIRGVPLPISHVDYEISAREQQNSANFGEDLETEDAEKAGRVLREDMEDLIFNGWGKSIQADGVTYDIGGYTSASSRITGSANDFGTASNVLDTLDAMLAALEQQGPDDNEGYMPEQEGVWWYIPTAQWGEVTRQADPRGDGNMNILTRIQQDYPYVDVRHAGALAPGEVVMVTQNRDVVDLADAQAPTNMSWDIEGGMATRYKTLGCRIPRIKSTEAGRSGIAHYTGA